MTLAPYTVRVPAPCLMRAPLPEITDVATPSALTVPSASVPELAMLPSSTSDDPPTELAPSLSVTAPEVASDDPPLLTPREREILTLIGQGMSNKAIARHLGISAHTVKYHLEAVFAKLGVRSRAEAVTTGLRQGLVLL